MATVLHYRRVVLREQGHRLDKFEGCGYRQPGQVESVLGTHLDVQAVPPGFACRVFASHSSFSLGNRWRVGVMNCWNSGSSGPLDREPGFRGTGNVLAKCDFELQVHRHASKVLRLELWQLDETIPKFLRMVALSYCNMIHPILEFGEQG